MAELVERDPTEVLGIVRVAVEAGRQVGTHDDVRALMVSTQRVAAEDHTACRRYIVHNNVSGLPLAAGHVGERDQPVEAIQQHVRPRLDRAGDRVELLLCRRRMGLHGDGQVGVVPPVARVVVVEDEQRLGVALGVVTRRPARGGPAPTATLSAGIDDADARRHQRRHCDQSRSDEHALAHEPLRSSRPRGR